MSGAIEARRSIEESLDFALYRWGVSIEEGDEKQKLYWLERVTHLLNERSKIDEIIKKIRAEAWEEAYRS